MSEIDWDSRLPGQASPGSPCLHTPRTKDLTLFNGPMVAPSPVGQICLGKSPSWAGSLSPWEALGSSISHSKSSGLRPFYGVISPVGGWERLAGWVSCA